MSSGKKTISKQKPGIFRPTAARELAAARQNTTYQSVRRGESTVRRIRLTGPERPPSVVAVEREGAPAHAALREENTC
jgi:hypothetical protein